MIRHVVKSKRRRWIGDSAGRACLNGNDGDRRSKARAGECNQVGAGSRHNIIGDQRTRPELRLRRVRDRIDREYANPLDVEGSGQWRRCRPGADGPGLWGSRLRLQGSRG